LNRGKAEEEEEEEEKKAEACSLPADSLTSIIISS
jgi:hypothetical protein